MTTVFDDAAFRGALGRFGSGVAIVSALHEGADHAMTVSAFTSVSLRPPRVLACVSRSSRFHDAIVGAGEWGVSILAHDGQDTATWLATKGRLLAGQLDRVPHHRGAMTGAALIDESLAWLECRTVDAFDGADHLIVVGEVVSAAVADHPDDPLMYYRSHYASLVRSASSEKTPSIVRPERDAGWAG